MPLKKPTLAVQFDNFGLDDDDDDDEVFAVPQSDTRAGLQGPPGRGLRPQGSYKLSVRCAILLACTITSCAKQRQQMPILPHHRRRR